MSRYRCPGCETSLDPRTACPGHIDVHVSPDDLLVCCRCCPHCRAETPPVVDEPEGRAVFSGSPLTWRGLHDSPSRARRNT